MAFTAAQITSLVEITGYAYTELSTVYAVGLTAAQETAVGADIVLWEASKNDHVKLKGGSKGVYLDSRDTINAIRERVFKHMGLGYMMSGSSGMGTLQIG